MIEPAAASAPGVIVDGEDNVTNHVACLFPPRRLEVCGNGNHLRLDPSADLSGFSIIIKGSGNLIVVGKNTRLRGLVYVLGNKSSLRIGPETTTETVRFSVGSRASIKMGRDCQVSRNVEIRCSDEHPIYDLDSREEINAGRDVVIGDHVWIGEGVRIIKGMMVASGSIVGTGAIVSRPLATPNAIYAGVPAKLIRQRIAWARTPGSMNWDMVDFTSE
ncbi:hypothetical protein C8J36_1132 [Rhizobium sp. PP-F2F-G48]|uniref:acyltransferase n=1 Tax=Rhizobium sp. PP-F2F-G48 TaxID=2135651 RepID=UPI00104AED6E|nr:hypothetical protein [Rhizobium sp. PP-F2F-G48]TCM48601.1 hypothetical protein C8J36_1132 [Rhizobium sp. PP-F2F-G48]